MYASWEDVVYLPFNLHIPGRWLSHPHTHSMVHTLRFEKSVYTQYSFVYPCYYLPLVLSINLKNSGN